jgi:hypothetical protein
MVNQGKLNIKATITLDFDLTNNIQVNIKGYHQFLLYLLLFYLN